VAQLEASARPSKAQVLDPARLGLDGAQPVTLAEFDPSPNEHGPQLALGHGDVERGIFPHPTVELGEQAPCKSFPRASWAMSSVAK
jgi:hypothetical protein